MAVNALIGSMVQKGYIQNDNTGILVTVRNDNEDKANKVKAEVLNDINTALSTNSVQATVINQTVKSTVDAKKFAAEINISIGKAVFVLNLAAKDGSLDAKELAKMKVSEIASLVVQKGIDIRDIVDYDSDDSIWENIADAIEDIDEDTREKGISTSAAVENTTVSATTAAQHQPAETQPAPAATTAAQPKANNTSGDIGVEKAKEIAMSHAGVLAGSVSFVKAKLDYEDGVKIYDIEFYSGNVEYDYEINAATGAIVSFDQDIENYAIPTQPAAAPTQPAAPSTISADRAKQIALSHAGVGSASFTKVELDTDDGVRVYEVEFKVGNVEYDYDIDATSGAILSSSSEIDD